MPTPLRPTLRLKAFLRRSRFAQLGLIVGFWWLGDVTARGLGLPVPGGVIGMAAMLLLLMFHGLGPAQVRRGANVLLADMLLFFVPAVMAVLDHREFVGLLGVKLLAAILFGTLLVMAGTALTVETVQRLVARHDR